MIGSTLMLSCQEAAWLYRAVILIRARKNFQYISINFDNSIILSILGMTTSVVYRQYHCGTWQASRGYA